MSDHLIVGYVVVSFLFGAWAATDAGFITIGEAAEGFVAVAIGWPLLLAVVVGYGLCKGTVALLRKAVAAGRRWCGA